MAFTPRVYSINNVQAVVKGIPAQGVAEDTPFETEREDEAEYKLKIGAKGEGTFVYNPNKAGTFIIRLKENEIETNKQYQDLKDSGAIFQVEFVGINGYTEGARGQYCMIGKAPRKKFSVNEEIREWKFITTELVETDK